MFKQNVKQAFRISFFKMLTIIQANKKQGTVSDFLPGDTAGGRLICNKNVITIHNISWKNVRGASMDRLIGLALE
ncbi:MAG: hypothetical protein Q4C63_03925, partial [Eubacteriales bacterium]|nr:hypothetical protein [Eubacteriales bacterium]